MKRRLLLCLLPWLLMGGSIVHATNNCVKFKNPHLNSTKFFPSGGSITLEVTDYKGGDTNEPVGISWTSDVPLESVTVKAGLNIYTPSPNQSGDFTVPGTGSEQKAISNVVFCKDEDPPPEECPPGTVGTPPNCMCPDGQVGTPPNCEDPPPEECPPGTVGTPPNCHPIPPATPPSNIPVLSPLGLIVLILGFGGLLLIRRSR